MFHNASPPFVGAVSARKVQNFRIKVNPFDTDRQGDSINNLSIR